MSTRGRRGAPHPWMSSDRLATTLERISLREPANSATSNSSAGTRSILERRVAVVPASNRDDNGTEEDGKGYGGGGDGGDEPQQDTMVQAAPPPPPPPHFERAVRNGSSDFLISYGFTGSDDDDDDDDSDVGESDSNEIVAAQPLPMHLMSESVHDDNARAIDMETHPPRPSYVEHVASQVKVSTLTDKGSEHNGLLTEAESLTPRGGSSCLMDASSKAASSVQQHRSLSQTQQQPSHQMTDDELALSIYESERMLIAEERRQSKTDEMMAKAMQSEFDHQASCQQALSPPDPKVEEERRRSIELDAKFASKLMQLEETNRKRLEKEREQQLEIDQALALAEQERDQMRSKATAQEEKEKLEQSGGALVGPGARTDQQIILDEELARTEAARDDIRRDALSSSVIRDEEVARAEAAREQATRELEDEHVAQSLHHVEQQQQQQQQQQQVASPTAVVAPPVISDVERQLRLSKCTVREITELEEVRRDNALRLRCAVCLEAYVLGDTVRTLPCFHSFHTRCIDTWICSKGTCPVDKSPCL